MAWFLSVHVTRDFGFEEISRGQEIVPEINFQQARNFEVNIYFSTFLVVIYQMGELRSFEARSDRGLCAYTYA